MTGGLVAFLRDRLDEDEQAARAAQLSTRPADELDGYATWRASDDGSGVWGDHISLAVDSYHFMRPELAAHIARHDPARVLAEVDAKRRIIDHLVWAATPGHTVYAGPASVMMTWLTIPYRDHPDYQPAWAAGAPAGPPSLTC